MNEQQFIPDGMRRELDQRIEAAKGNIATVRQELEKQLKLLGAQQATQTAQSPEAQTTNGEISMLRGELLYLDSVASRQQAAAGTTGQRYSRAGEPAPTGSWAKWQAYQPSKSLLLWALVAGVVLTLIIGFAWGGWMTRSAASKLADATASAAVAARLAPICVAQFNLDPDKDAKLLEMSTLSSSKRAEYVRTQGWAVMPGEEKPDRLVVDGCTKLLMQIGK